MNVGQTVAVGSRVINCRLRSAGKGEGKKQRCPGPAAAPKIGQQFEWPRVWSIGVGPGGKCVIVGRVRGAGVLAQLLMEVPLAFVEL